MSLLLYTSSLLGELTSLINAQAAALPPGWELAPAQVRRILQHAERLWAAHFPDQEPALERLQTLCLVEDGRLQAAAQWGKHGPQAQGIADIDTGLLFWAAAAPGRLAAAQRLLEGLLERATAAGCRRLVTLRCSFGLGWPGLPAVWEPISAALEQTGFTVANRWTLLSGPAPLAAQPPPPKLNGSALVLARQADPAAGEWNLRLQVDGAPAGECSAWGVPEHYQACPGAAGWCTVEWLGVEPAFQRLGLGGWLLAEQARDCANRGISRLVMWTETSNQAMLGLAQALQLERGPECREYAWG